MKTKKFLNRLSLGLVLGYVALLTFPQLLYANKLEHESFILYYHGQEMNEELKALLDKSEALLQKSELDESAKPQKVFLTSGSTEFTIFAPVHRKAFGVNYPGIRNIFVAPSDVVNDEVIRNAETHNRRQLSAVIAHETLHSRMEHKLGFLTYRFLDSWKNEGYCDYVVNESSFPMEEGLKRMCSGEKPPSSPSYTYFTYRMFTQHLFEVEKVTLDEFLNNEFDLIQLEKKWRDHHCD